MQRRRASLNGLGTWFAALLWLAWGAPLLPGAEPAPTNAVPTDDVCRQLVVGTWRDHYRGVRTMTVRPDGTATMQVELSGATAVLYASRLRFDMKWSIENGRLKKQTTGGSPSGKVKLILKLMGDRVDEPILALTSERLLLLDGDGKKRYDWKRLPSATPAKEPADAARNPGTNAPASP